MQHIVKECILSKQRLDSCELLKVRLPSMVCSPYTYLGRTASSTPGCSLLEESLLSEIHLRYHSGHALSFLWSVVVITEHAQLVLQQRFHPEAQGSALNMWRLEGAVQGPAVASSVPIQCCSVV